MAGIASKIAKTVAGTAAAAGIYYAGKQSGMKEALELEASDATGVLDGEAVLKKSVYPTPSESPEAFHAALNDRADSLRNRIFEQVYSEGSLEERFDKIVGNDYLSVEQTEIPVEQEPQENAPTEIESPITDSETTSEPEIAEATAQPEISIAEETTPLQTDDIDLKNAKTGDLDPYHRIQKALSTSEFFAEENDEERKPPEFEMP